MARVKVLKICEDARVKGERANLTGADLRYANLTGADLTGADLRYANLRGANLTRANLRGADLRYANLRGANLTRANLRGAILADAILADADLTGADLRYANLRYANLRGANLTRANLNGANFECANFNNANLDGAKNIPSSVAVRLMVCPEVGRFIGHKKANGCYIKLRIPASAKRSNATTRKCRCSKAFVVEITNIKTGEEVSEIASDYDENIIYKKGKYVLPDYFDENRWDECSNGIHFFMTREEAIRY